MAKKTKNNSKQSSKNVKSSDESSDEDFNHSKSRKSRKSSKPLGQQHLTTDYSSNRPTRASRTNPTPLSPKRIVVKEEVDDTLLDFDSLKGSKRNKLANTKKATSDLHNNNQNNYININDDNKIDTSVRNRIKGSNNGNMNLSNTTDGVDDPHHKDALEFNSSAPSNGTKNYKNKSDSSTLKRSRIESIKNKSTREKPDPGDPSVKSNKRQKKEEQVETFDPIRTESANTFIFSNQRNFHDEEVANLNIHASFLHFKSLKTDQNANTNAANSSNINDDEIVGGGNTQDDINEGANPLADKLEDLKNKVETFKKEQGIKNYEDSQHNVPFDKVFQCNNVKEPVNFMSNDFINERSVKMAICKRISRNNQNQFKFLEKERLNKYKDLEKQAKKCSQLLAKDVKKFWGYINKLVIYKRQKEQDEEKVKLKKEEMHKLLRKSEKQSSQVKDNIVSYEKLEEEYEKNKAIEDKASLDEVKNLQMNQQQEQQQDDAESFEDLNIAQIDDDQNFTIDSNPSFILTLTRNSIEQDIVRKSAPKQSNQNNDPFAMNNINKDNIEQYAANLKTIQPKGHTLEDHTSKIQQPYILKHSLREQQLIGLEWLVALHDRKINGILADEMGLGKTMQTVSLLAHLACVQGVWGPHLIVVPTTILNQWEMEIKKWCPSFKVVNQQGTVKERKAKRLGWSKPNAVHIIITSYKIILQDHKILKRHRFYQMILDEAHHIKNFKSQRWTCLLSFKVKRRLLLTGTPLQNDLMELWSLMHFLMPKIFYSHQDFKDWFSAPVSSAIQNDQLSDLDNLQLKATIDRLHTILRPFVLRRMKFQVEKQLPPKFEHIVSTRLSRRQRFLQDEFIHRDATQKDLAKGDQLGLLNVLMQLRKVCNHPDLFEERQTSTPLETEGISQTIKDMLDIRDSSGLGFQSCVLQPIEIVNLHKSLQLSSYDQYESQNLLPRQQMAEIMNNQNDQNEPLILQGGASVSSQNEAASKWLPKDSSVSQVANVNSLILPSLLPPSSSFYYLPNFCSVVTCPNISSQFNRNFMAQLLHSEKQKPFRSHNHYANLLNEKQIKSKMERNNSKLPFYRQMDMQTRRNIIESKPVYSYDLINSVKIDTFVDDLNQDREQPQFRFYDLIMYKPWNKGIGVQENQSNKRSEAIALARQVTNVNYYTFIKRIIDTIKSMIKSQDEYKREWFEIEERFYIPVVKIISKGFNFYHTNSIKNNKYKESQITLNRTTLKYSHQFKNFVCMPEKFLVQFDCGKLQALAELLHKINLEGSKCLIFTQMSKMLDIIEKFMNIHSYNQVRLDGSTKVEKRQYCVDKFNKDPNILAFISSTRSGGVGLNLTAASQVVFQDTDWNPAMDKQAQDRCHRIGQMKPVHIYRLISKLTVEENILKKSLQKRLLDEMVLKQGNFNIKSLFKKDDLRQTQIGLEKITFKDLDCDERMNIISRDDFLKGDEFREERMDETAVIKPKPTNNMDDENIQFEPSADQKKSNHPKSSTNKTDTNPDDDMGTDNNNPTNKTDKSSKDQMEDMEEEEEAIQIEQLVEDEEDAVQVKHTTKEIEEQEEQFEDDFEGDTTSARVDVEQYLTPIMLQAFNSLLDAVPKLEVDPTAILRNTANLDDSSEDEDDGQKNLKMNEIRNNESFYKSTRDQLQGVYQVHN